MADDHERALVDARQPADDGAVVRVHAVTVQFVELAADGVDVIKRVGPVRVARELGDLPGRETGEDAHRELPALGLQPADLVLDVDFAVRSHVPELLDLRFELGDRLFEVEERDGHACRVS